VEVVGAHTEPGGMPFPSTTTERLMRRFPQSTGLLPAFSQPHGTIVMQLSTANSEGSKPIIRS
jgi:hypothetical protein